MCGRYVTIVLNSYSFKDNLAIFCNIYIQFLIRAPIISLNKLTGHSSSGVGFGVVTTILFLYRISEEVFKRNHNTIFCNDKILWFVNSNNLHIKSSALRETV